MHDYYRTIHYHERESTNEIDFMEMLITGITCCSCGTLNGLSLFITLMQVPFIDAIMDLFTPYWYSIRWAYRKFLHSVSRLFPSLQKGSTVV